MFSGIVEEVGRVERIDTSGDAPLVIRCRTVLEGTRLGDSIAVDGVCLTVAEQHADRFVANVQPVTFRQSALGSLRPGDPVNLERSVAVGGRIGGHYVQGHVDGVGRVAARRGDGPSVVVRVAAGPEILRYVVLRGYVAVDGASLTVAALHDDGFEVSLVRHTQGAVTLPGKPPGSPVNIEVDVLAKYVERIVAAAGAGRGEAGPSSDDRLLAALRANGYA